MRQKQSQSEGQRSKTWELKTSLLNSPPTAAAQSGRLPSLAAARTLGGFCGFYIISRSSFSLLLYFLKVELEEEAADRASSFSSQEPNDAFLIFLPLLFGNGREERKIQSVSSKLRKMVDQAYVQTAKHWLLLFVCFNHPASWLSNQPESPASYQRVSMHDLQGPLFLVMETSRALDTSIYIHEVLKLF